MHKFIQNSLMIGFFAKAIEHFLMPGVFGGIIIGFVFGWHYSKGKWCLPNIIYNASAQNTIFAFDLHGVLVTPSFSETLSIIWHDLIKIKVLVLLLNPIVWYYLIKALFGMTISEETVDKLCKRNPQLVYIKSVLIKFMSAQNIDIKNIEFLAILRAKKYDVYVLSNIWPEALENLLRRFPVLSDLVTAFYIPTTEKKFNYYKPQVEFFESFKKFLIKKEKHKKQIIFIDNSLRNIKSANKAGLHGILVRSLDDLILQFQNNHD